MTHHIGIVPWKLLFDNALPEPLYLLGTELCFPQCSSCIGFQDSLKGEMIHFLDEVYS